MAEQSIYSKENSAKLAWQIKRYVYFNKLLKVGVPLLLICFLTIVIGWPYLRDTESGFTLSFQDLEKSNEQIRMIEPVYVGTDGLNRPFRIKAKSAIQSPENQDEVKLLEIRASVEMRDKSEAVLSASEGVYNPHTEKLWLGKGIRIVTDSGYEFMIESVAYDLHSAIAESQSEVRGIAPFGSFRADSFRAQIDGKSMKLLGDVRVRIMPEQHLDAAVRGVGQ